MDRTDVLIAHHSNPSFSSSTASGGGPVSPAPTASAYVAARVLFWMTLGASAGFVYAYGWLVG